MGMCEQEYTLWRKIHDVVRLDLAQTVPTYQAITNACSN